MIDLHLVVNNSVGLHARPAALFVKTVSKFKSSIKIRNISRNSDQVDAKSILRVLTLGVAKGHEIGLQIDGEDEQQAADALKELAESNFGEEA